MPTSRRTALSGLAAAGLLAALAACGTNPNAPAGTTDNTQPTAPASSAGTPSSSPSSSSTPTTAPVSMTANVKDKATKVKVDTVLSAKATDGTLTKVTVAYTYTDNKGASHQGTVAGGLNKAKTSWTATERLDPSGSYKMTMVGQNSAGTSATTTSSFKTQSLALNDQAFAELYPLKGSTVGVGMPVVLRFDTPITDKAAVQKQLSVTSSPAQEGTWAWYGNQEVHYRTKNYWKPGTKVTVKANLNGVNAGGGIYGQNSTSTSFTVGRSFVVKVNLGTDVAHVYKNGKKVRTIYVSGGKPGWETRSGTSLISDKEYNKVMTNEMIGAKEKYRLTAKYALRITNSGEFLHSAPWNTGNFGVRNASHGCIGMSIADSGYLYTNTLIGDPVTVSGTKRSLDRGNGYTDWNISYQEFKKSSAL